MGGTPTQFPFSRAPCPTASRFPHRPIQSSPSSLPQCEASKSLGLHPTTHLCPCLSSILCPMLRIGISGCSQAAWRRHQDTRIPSGKGQPYLHSPGPLAGRANPHPTCSLGHLLPPPPRLAPMEFGDPEMTPKKSSSPSPTCLLATLNLQWCLGGQGKVALLSSQKDDCGAPEPPKLTGRIGVPAGTSDQKTS